MVIQMKVFLNPGHDRQLDPGACNSIHGLHEADVVDEVTETVSNCIRERLESAGVET
jgi:N-acetylmuramoyl-L-alanine amidase